jgi:HSP20 family protein
MAYGKFSRTFALKDDVETDKISAELKDGLLTISLPLKEKQGSKSIDIQ